MRLAKIVPLPPTYIRACNTSKFGMGGIWVSIDQDSGPIIYWHTAFPASIQNQLILEGNPQGLLNNSQLELAGTIAHDAMLLSADPSTAQSVLAGCNNIMAILWLHKGLLTTAGPVMPLLHLKAQLSRANYYCSTCIHVPGDTNTVADLCSCSFHLDLELLLLFCT